MAPPSDEKDKEETLTDKKTKDESDLPRPAIYTLVQDILNDFLSKQNKNEDGDFLKKLMENSNSINSSKFLGNLEHSYEDASERLAYILVHFSQQTYLVNSILSDAYAACTNLQTRTTVFNELMRSVDWGRISVFSFGGGSAADVFGVLMWLHRFGFNSRVSACAIDTCKNWEPTVSTILKTMQFESEDKEKKPTPQQKYTHNLWKKMDGNIKFFNSSLKASTALFKPGSKEMVMIGQADIISLPFVLSSVVEDPETSNTIQCILNAVKPGAILIYLDHPEGGQTELINNLAYWCGMRRIYFMKQMNYSMPKYESDDILEKFAKGMENPISRESKITAIVYKKPSGFAYDRRIKMSRREQNNVKGAQIRLKKSNPDFKLFKPSSY